MAAADQEARNVAILVAGQVDDGQLGEVVDDLEPRRHAAPGCSPPTGAARVRRAAPPRPRGAPRPGRRGDHGRRRRRRPGADAGRHRRRDRSGPRAASTPDALRSGVAAGLARHRRPRPRADGGWPAPSPRWLGRRISEPLLDVAEVAHQLRAGDLSARAEVRRHRGDRGAGPRPQRPGGAHQRAAGRRAGRGRRPLAPAAHAGHRAAARRRGGRRTPSSAGGSASTSACSSAASTRSCTRPAGPSGRDLREACDAAEVVAGAGRVLAGAGRGPGPAVDRRAARAGDAGAARRRRPGRRGRRAGRQRLRAHARADRLRGPAAPARRQVPLVVDRRGSRSGSVGARRRPGPPGLGLDIARRTAVACGGSLTFGAGPAGDPVELTLPMLARLSPRQWWLRVRVCVPVRCVVPVCVPVCESSSSPPCRRRRHRRRHRGRRPRVSPPCRPRRSTGGPGSGWRGSRARHRGGRPAYCPGRRRCGPRR